MTREDFKCPCCGENDINDDLVQRIKNIESECGVKLHINSGFRCEKHNKEVGGSPTSSHLVGLAADIGCTSNKIRFSITKNAIAEGITRIELKPVWVHLDIDTTKTQGVIWLK